MQPVEPTPWRTQRVTASYNFDWFLPFSHDPRRGPGHESFLGRHHAQHGEIAEAQRTQ